MRPILEQALVDALRLAQVSAAIARDTGIKDMMVGALDDIDGVDLNVTELFDHSSDRLRPVAERRRRIEPLGT